MKKSKDFWRFLTKGHNNCFKLPNWVCFIHFFTFWSQSSHISGKEFEIKSTSKGNGYWRSFLDVHVENVNVIATEMMFLGHYHGLMPLILYLCSYRIDQFLLLWFFLNPERVLAYIKNNNYLNFLSEWLQSFWGVIVDLLAFYTVFVWNLYHWRLGDFHYFYRNFENEEQLSHNFLYMYMHKQILI